MEPRNIFVIAGEASGDALGAKLIKALKEKDSSLTFEGIGGERMRSEGIYSLFPMHELSIMGFAELIPHIPHLLKRINQTVSYIMETKPDVVITIDSPGFCCRVARKLRELNCKTKLIHYVAPTVWAYKPERAAKMAALFDHLLVLLPFEPPYFEKENLPCTFVGHSIIEEPISEGNGVAFRKAHGIEADAPVLCVLAGSRGGEISRMLPVFTEVVRRLSKKIPDLTVIFPTVPTVAAKVKEAASSLPVKSIVVESLSEKYSAYAASNAALAKSGTATLEIAKAGVPMVVSYRVSAISAWMIRKMIKIPYVNLINILLNKEIIPECLQEKCNPTVLTEKIEQLFNNDSIRSIQLEATAKAFAMLGEGEAQKPSEKAAEIVLSIIKK